MGRRNQNNNQDDRPNRPNRQDRRDRRQTNMRNRATTDVSISQQPALDAIQRQIEQAQLDYQNQVLGAQSAYGGYQDLLAPMAGQYTTANTGIGNALAAQLSQLSGALGGMQGMPSSEADAVASLYGGVGGGAESMLAGNSQRAEAYNQSASREGGLAERYALQNLQGGMEDYLQQLNNRSLDITDQTPLLIRQRLDELRQQRIENQLAKSQIQGNNAVNEYLQNQVGDLVNNDQGGRQNNNTTTTGGRQNNQDPGRPGGRRTPPPPTDTTSGGQATLPSWILSNPGLQDMLQTNENRGYILHSLNPGARRDFLRQNWHDIAGAYGWEPPRTPSHPRRRPPR